MKVTDCSLEIFFTLHLFLENISCFVLVLGEDRTVILEFLHDVEFSGYIKVLVLNCVHVFSYTKCLHACVVLYL
jgi:hypothetical protein